MRRSPAAVAPTPVVTTAASEIVVERLGVVTVGDTMVVRLASSLTTILVASAAKVLPTRLDDGSASARRATSAGATLVLGGTIERSGDQLRAILQLRNAATRTIVWSERVNGSITKLGELESELEAKVRAAVDGLATAR
jgi:TolB-like protein